MLNVGKGIAMFQDRECAFRTCCLVVSQQKWLDKVVESRFRIGKLQVGRYKPLSDAR